MRVWRICKQRRAADALSGEGARLYGGRWNSPGKRVVYASATLSLAALEILVHAGRSQQPTDLVAIAIEIPASVSKSHIRRLPADWRAFPLSAGARSRGDAWLAAAAVAVWRVPSVVVPGEYNYLLNPAHPQAARCRIVSTEPFGFDPRLF